MLISAEKRNGKQTIHSSSKTPQTHLHFFTLRALISTPGREIILGIIMVVDPALLHVYVDRLSHLSETSGWSGLWSGLHLPCLYSPASSELLLLRLLDMLRWGHVKDKDEAVLG